ncbi:hypothetical protein Ahy_A04g018423 [Arachis hypogaea]|uniref:Aminotransferase-like plant mobile domain-containing protein n=1 Tax=Arachis hypogaea TaxID=3818 RepID=A0A445DDM1_ARAHY|nr:hypothetical protein Ahy_A04g018423 [Arachis hypogaea]
MVYWVNIGQGGIAGVWMQGSTRGGIVAEQVETWQHFFNTPGACFLRCGATPSTYHGCADSPRRGRGTWRPVKRSRDPCGIPMLLHHHAGGVLQAACMQGTAPPPRTNELFFFYINSPLLMRSRERNEREGRKFEWQPYDGLIVPDELHPHLEVCDIVAPLLSFECVEWHPANRVMHQFGYLQSPPRAPRDIPFDQHCIVLRGVKLHDWTVLHGPWIAEWTNRRHSRMRNLHPLPTCDFLPMAEYRDWYVRSYGHLLRLTAYVPHHPQPPAPQPPPPRPPQHAVFEPFSYYIPQSLAYSHSSHHTQGSHHSQQSQHSHHSQHDEHGDQQLQHWIDAGLGGWSDFSGIPSPSVPADPRRVSVDMAHGLWGRTSNHTSESASCDSGFIQRQRAYAVVDTFNPCPSAPAEAGGSVAPTDAGGSTAPTEAGGSRAPGVDDSVRGHPYDLRTKQNPPDRYTPSRFGQGIMRKGLH